ncbi:YqjF family protein [Yinghuangia soli]|uniref:DUF2071 domain-containing protein n=1 Tax=Yinghuangia soli TaxID=2908204 RepID=A0AA41U0Y5_9ACTN|nr:DUF2071 domain-containing protein [Yinghuangia soli]MCF2530263.1 DUF2071 domain-containing protein [Yinghuangia soli]
MDTGRVNADLTRAARLLHPTGRAASAAEAARTGAGGGRSADPVPPEPVTRTAPRPVGPVILTQGWRDLAFLHWPADPAAVAPLLPPGTEPDLFDGTTYVGLVPFRMERVGIGRGPAVPYLGTFAETNVRLYSVDRAGRRGVVFRSLEAARLIPTLAARLLFALPYQWAAMTLTRHGTPTDPQLRYATRRHRPGRAGTGGTVHIRIRGRITDPDPLTDFLTARWGLHVHWHGRTLYLPNTHPRWPLHHADLLHHDTNLIPAAGLPAPGGPPVSVLYSPGVKAQFGPPQRCP